MDTKRTADDQIIFEDTIKVLEAQIANVGAHLTIDSSARLAYAREIKRMAEKLRADAVANRITWASAAQQAQETRNVVMEVIRSRSTPVGRAMAQRIKSEGLSLNLLIARQTRKMFGESANFSRLTSSKQNAVYADRVLSRQIEPQYHTCHEQNFLCRPGAAILVDGAFSLFGRDLDQQTASDQKGACCKRCWHCRRNCRWSAGGPCVWAGCSGLRHSRGVCRWRNGRIRYKLYLVTPCD